MRSKESGLPGRQGDMFWTLRAIGLCKASVGQLACPFFSRLVLGVAAAEGQAMCGRTVVQ